METNKAARTEQIAHSGEAQPGKVMLITPERILYAGLLGRPMIREFGSLTIYVSLGNPIHLQLGDGAWRSADLWVVQPETPHKIAAVDRMIGMYMIEPELIDMDRLPAFLQEGNRDTVHPDMLARFRETFHALIEGRARPGVIRSQLDQFMLGETLVARRLDPRITAAVECIKCNPRDASSAEQFAEQADLSFSRFLHLFKAEVGTTFRRFRAWKRARSFLAYVNTDLNLTDIALEAGYPDSSHFSHTVRRYWGLTPKDIMAGSRTLAVITDSEQISATHTLLPEKPYQGLRLS
ncbi:MAG TPA: AraC family transcriptional regulator [Noviherbaspirillum sp.]|uniref:helix-turn-helix transcriptional regulator n=1 Tax=Noviherbaspirillum sp. TaxID=1926288 RepID=UPI002B4A21ED|nr:AraC family transcriptional regulator [Noviherbaspirillum sp.]HJV87759.1 AraC family transcriptional regulator [Noviherbaspirillum sp.]